MFADLADLIDPESDLDLAQVLSDRVPFRFVSVRSDLELEYCLDPDPDLADRSDRFVQAQFDQIVLEQEADRWWSSWNLVPIVSVTAD